MADTNTGTTSNTNGTTSGGTTTGSSGTTQMNEKLSADSQGAQTDGSDKKEERLSEGSPGAQESEDSGGMSAGDIAGTVTMGLGAIAATSGSMLQNIFGVLPKAMLFVPKAFSAKDMNAMSALTGSNDVLALKSLVKKKKVEAKRGVASRGIAARLKSVGLLPIAGLVAERAVAAQTLTNAMSTNNYSCMEVQYNPKSISISSTAGPMTRPPAPGDMANDQIVVTADYTQIRFNVELVFTDVNAADAFHLESLEMNAEKLTEFATSMVKSGFMGGYSVKKQCDGLLSLLNFNKLKQVVFVWSDMFFHGELTNVSVNYELFNKQGNPIAAKVQLTLLQASSGNKREMFASDISQWDESIDIAFGPPDLTTMTQM